MTPQTLSDYVDHGRNLISDSFASDYDEVSFAVGEVVDDGGQDQWMIFNSECVERSLEFEILLENDPEEFEDGEVVDPGDTDELAIFIGSIRNEEDHTRLQVAAYTPKRAPGKHGLKISLMREIGRASCRERV